MSYLPPGVDNSHRHRSDDLVDPETDELYVPPSGGLLSASVTLTDAQIKALPTTSVQIVAAPGAGKMLHPVSMLVIVDCVGVYANTDVDSRFWWDLGNAGACFMPMGSDLFAMFSLVRKTVSFYRDTQESGTGAVLIDFAESENSPLTVRAMNNAGDLTGGNAANTMKVTVLYSELDV